MGKDALFLVLKITMSGCDAWTGSCHFGAMRGTHVEAKPSAEGGKERNSGAIRSSWSCGLYHAQSPPQLW